jgi:hypothetical protein
MATASKFVLEGDKWVIEKDPGAKLDYVWPWTDWLAGVADTIASVVVTAANGVVVDSFTNTTTAVTVWVSGGTVSKTKLASVAVKITTAGGRIDERTAYFRITQR